MPDDEQNNKDNINNNAATPDQPVADTGLDAVGEPQGDAAPASDTPSAASTVDIASDAVDTSPVNPPVAPETQGPEPMSAPVGVPPVATPVAPVASDSGKKSNKTLIGCLIGVVVVVIIAVVLVLVIGGGSKQLSVDSVKKYCSDNGLTVTTKHQDDYDLDTVSCNASDYGVPVTQIEFAVAKKPIMELEGYSNDIDSLLTYFDAETLIDSNNYKKIYASFLGQTIYIIIKDNTLMMISGTNEGVKKALIDFGYPDDKWGSDSGQDHEEKDDTDYSSQDSQRDTQRRSDLANVMTAVVSYQTNNNGNLPNGPSYWIGSETIECDASNVACAFVRDYLNSGATNTFLDPDGEPYSMDITENLVTNGSISSDHGNTFSYLEETSDGYTIGGSLPFYEHVVFIVPGGQCGTNGNVVKAQSVGSVAVMYMLENDDVYCIDNQ